MHCQAQMTDGFISEAAVTQLGVSQNVARSVLRLTKVGLWKRIHTKTRTGYVVNDYLEYNPSRAEMLVKREKDLERKRKFHADSAQNPNRIGAESAQIPDDPSRARASHPIPSQLRTRTKSSAGRPAPTIQDRIKRIELGRSTPEQNQKIITKMAHEVLATANGDGDADLVEAIKRKCVEHHVAYNSTVCHNALDSARVQRKLS
jgi:hypothetical protein